MLTKMIEIRDSMTCIAAMAIQMLADETRDPNEYRFLRREGYPPDGSSITLMRLADQKATNDPYEWPSITRDARTMPTAHDYIIRNWPAIKSGQVVDVQVILGETSTPETPEIGERH